MTYVVFKLLTRVGGWVEKMGIKLSQPQLELKLSWVEAELGKHVLLVHINVGFKKVLVLRIFVRDIPYMVKCYLTNFGLKNCWVQKKFGPNKKKSKEFEGIENFKDFKDIYDLKWLWSLK